MKDCIIIRNESGEKEKVQKRLLLLNLKELYQFLKEEHPDAEIGLPNSPYLDQNIVFWPVVVEHTVFVYVLITRT